ncbi:uncharacterized protein [Typha latifolia]|uniref:uncharacterized protein n=1 Tax=Typha latifolia TaxID=4733 RepID=UPI003C305BDF
MSRAVEESGLFAVDCVVVCCCCPCLVLQLTVFLFIRLPHKLAVKSKRTFRMLRRRSKGGRVVAEVELEKGDRMVVDQGTHALPFEEERWFPDERRSWIEADKVWEELVVEEGLFWFGSFWANGDH